MLKILILCSTLDLSKPFGATPALWQLFKGFYEEGHELIIVPYHGKEIQSLWWKCYPNPNYYEGQILEKIISHFKISNKKNSSIIPKLARMLTKPKLEDSLLKIFENENEIEAFLMIGVPLNQLTGLPKKIRKYNKIPIIFYDLDVPTALPSHGGFTFNYYKNAEFDEIDSFIIPSEGSINELKELGARNIHIVHFGVDPDVYSPLSVEKDIDFFFFGNGGKAREKNISMMIAGPSKKLHNKFLVSGRSMDVDLGNSTLIPPISFTEWRKYASRTKINLNVVRELHASFRATSTSRPFELGAMKCCTVSAPYDGLEKWFEIGKEIFIVNSEKDCIDTYQMILNDDELRERVGLAAQKRVLKDHTSRNRAKEIISIIQKYI